MHGCLSRINGEMESSDMGTDNLAISVSNRVGHTANAFPVRVAGHSLVEMVATPLQ